MIGSSRQLLESQLERLRHTGGFRGKWEVFAMLAAILGLSACTVYADGSFNRFSGLLCALVVSIQLTIRICLAESARGTQHVIEALLGDEDRR